MTPPGEPDAPCLPPAVPDYQLLRRIGSGSYGDVWLARSVLGQYRAVKIVHRGRFSDPRPFEREFEGIQRFEPISRSHPSQLHILHVGKNDDAGCFYYVMELADAAPLSPGGEPTVLTKPPTPVHSSATTDLPNADALLAKYSPRTLRHDLQQCGRLPIADCVRIGLSLTTALTHLHAQGLVHRDVKPSNVIFVNGVAKLGDLGLVTDAGDTKSIVGTEGYLPPEGPGTVQADLYSLGKVLYEISTGMDRRRFAELPDDIWTWVDQNAVIEFNEIVLKACAKEPAQRYASAENVWADLEVLQTGKSLRRSRALARVSQMSRKVALFFLPLAALIAFVWSQYLSPPKSKSFDGQPSPIQQANALCTKALLQLRGDNYVAFSEAYSNLYRSLELDPRFARAYVGLMELFMRETPQPFYTTNDSMSVVVPRLVELAPNLAPTLVGQAYLAYNDFDFVRARELGLRAIEASPDYEFAHTFYGFMLTHWGFPEEGRRQMEIGKKFLDSKVTTYRVIGHTYFVQRDFSGAVRSYQEALDWERHHITAYFYMGCAYQAMTNYSNAITAFENADLLLEATTTNPAPDLVKARYAELRSVLSQKGPVGYWEEQKRWLDGVPRPYARAKILMHLGDTNGAFTALQESWMQHEQLGIQSELTYLVFDEVWDDVRANPDFQKLLDDVGFTKVNPKLRVQPSHKK